MSAATFTPTRNHEVPLESLRLPAILSGVVLFAGGLITQQPWMSFLGVAAFLGTYMSASETSRPGTRRSARQAMFDDEHPAQDAFTTVDINEIMTRAENELQTSQNAAPAMRLRPIVPLHAGLEVNSWLGGTPYLPQDINWPILDDQPALFLAQISLAHVPANIWQGKGPRDGWLLMFASQSNLENVKLLHTHRFGDERQPPTPLAYPFLTPHRVDLLDRVTARPASPPRWPVELCHPDEGASHSLERHHKGERPGNPMEQLTTQAQLTDPELAPFDWTSAMLLLEVALADLDWQHKVVSTLADAGTDALDADTFLEALTDTILHLQSLQDELSSAHDSGLPFDDTLRDLMLRGMGALGVDTGDNDPSTCSLLEHDQIRRDYVHWFDLYARLTYCDTPDALPPAPRSRFEEIWAWHAMHERGWIGGTIPDDFAPVHADDHDQRLPLLRLQSSDLLGWNFGQKGELCILVPADDLARGDFSRAHGKLSSG